jgi:hypothetical protein
MRKRLGAEETVGEIAIFRQLTGPGGPNQGTVRLLAKDHADTDEQHQ